MADLSEMLFMQPLMMSSQAMAARLLMEEDTVLKQEHQQICEGLTVTGTFIITLC